MSTGNILNTLSMVDPSFKLMENLDAGSNPNYVPEFTIHGGGNLQSEYENSPNMPTFILDGFEVSSEKIFDLDPNRVAKYYDSERCSCDCYLRFACCQWSGGRGNESAGDGKNESFL